MSDLGRCTGRDHHTATTTVRDRTALEGHVDAVSQGDLFLAQSRRLLCNRLRLTGQCRLVRLQFLTFSQAQIGRDSISRLQQHHIARHQLRRRYREHPFIAADARIGRCQRAQRHHRALGAILLDRTDQCIQQHDHQYRDTVLRVAHQPGNQGRRQQDQNHEVAELAEKHTQRRASGRTRNLVGPGVPETTRRLCR